MGHISFDKKFSFKRFLTGKGFYVALAVCLVAVCGIGVVTFLDALPDAVQTPGTGTTTRVTASTTLKAVDSPVTNVPDDRTKAPTTKHATTTTEAAATVSVQPKALYVLPLSNEVLRAYSDGKPVFSSTMSDWRTHNGVDFKGAKGQTVKAIADGTVKQVVSDPLWGSMLVIDHGYGVESRYCGVTVTSLKDGQAVKAGEGIGTLADIPCELMDGAHLHLEITVNGAYTDPVKAIGREVKQVVTTTAAAATKAK